MRGSDRSLVRHAGTRRTRVVRSLLRLALRSGAARWLPLPRLWVVPDSDGIEAHLARILGQPVQVAVLLGPPRTNLKPVLQVFGSDGATLAFAKVATSPLTERLLTTEASALRRLAGIPMRGVVIPALLDASRWRDSGVLVQTALPHSQSDREPTTLPGPALAAIATSCGVQVRRLEESELWRRLSVGHPERWHGIDVSAFTRLRRALSTHITCAFGAWHGDFGPWNAAWSESELEVWDWERFETGVPIGMDAAHWRMQLSMAGDLAPSALWARMTDDVAQVLRLARCDPSGAGLVSGCYLLTVWSRYRHDATGAAGAALRARVTRLSRLADVAARALRAENL